MKKMFAIGALLTAGCTGSVEIAEGTPAVSEEPAEPAEPVAPEATGALLWTQLHDTPGYDFAQDVAFDSQGRILVVGTVQPAVESQSNDVWIAAYSPDGGLAWHDVYDASKGSESERGVALAVGPDDSVVVVAALDSAPGKSLLRKYAPDGTELFTQLRAETVWDVAVDDEGAIVLIGTLDDDSAWLAKLDGQGQLVWEQNEGAEVAYGTVALDGDNHIHTLLWYAFDLPSLLQRFDGDGNLEQELATDCGHVLGVDTVGNVWVGGDGGPASGLCKYDGDLVLAWHREDGATTAVRGLAVDRWGNALVSGYADEWPGSESTVMWLRKYDAEGVQQWEDHYGGPTGEFGFGFQVAVNAAGEVAATGIVVDQVELNYAIVVRKLGP